MQQRGGVSIARWFSLTSFVLVAALAALLPGTAWAQAAMTCRDPDLVAKKLCGNPPIFPCEVKIDSLDELREICFAECGDGIVDAGEQCDDGNNVNGDGCSATCQIEPPGAFCGDGNVDAGEQCDDGNNVNGDGCSATCRIEPPPPVCGDGKVDAGEQCDDGNNANGDGCSATCQIEPPPPVCGDGKVDAGEQCDDGNNANGDGCSATCQIEPPAGNQGCTPGYWKASQHFDSWPSPYTQAMLFESVFLRDVPGNPTLHASLTKGGGGLIALMRHTVAALLNAASGGVNYPLSVAEVIARFQAAFDSGLYETQKNEFEKFNQLKCPLN